VLAIVSGSLVLQRIVSERFPRSKDQNLPMVSRLIGTGEWRATFDDPEPAMAVLASGGV
jgi:hypothetical protein